MAGGAGPGRPDLPAAVEAANGANTDVVIVDPWKAGAAVGELVARLSKEIAGAAIVVLTSDGGARLLSQAVKGGVKGYVLVLDQGDRTLSARQREILQMLADGMRTEAVANDLHLSTETVRTHTKRILAKLDASTRTQAVAIGLRHGLIE